MTEPCRIDITMYGVGFGDCFLLSFHYAVALEDGRTVRHMLIDFGSTSLADDKAGPPDAKIELDRIASLIRDHTAGKLDVLVVTHRHRDHLSAFGNHDAAAFLQDLNPELVLRPWVDKPGALGHSGIDDANSRYVASLTMAQDVAGKLGIALGQVVASATLDGEEDMEVGASGTGNSHGILKALVSEANNSSPNHEAVQWLDERAKGDRGRYLSYGNQVELESVIPGVHCDVLGPPTVDQWPDVAKQRYDDEQEFWLAQSQLASHDWGLAPAVSEERDWAPLTGEGGIGPALWLLDRLAAHQQDCLEDLVDKVDGALNNTSLILLFTAGSRRMLFPGDAQIENWEYVLFEAAKVRPADKLPGLLNNLDVYKVGHHGSRNATPRSLVELWRTRDDSAPPMVGLMSTKPGVHGKDGPNPVPKQTLIDALTTEMTLYRTDGFGPGQTFLRLTASAECGGELRPFEPTSDGS